MGYRTKGQMVVTLSEFNEYGKRIVKQIWSSSHPLSVKMLKYSDEVPEVAKRPTADYGKCLSTCQVFALSRKYGECVAQLFEDMWCPEPVIGLGLAEPPQYFLDGNNRYPDGVASQEAGANWAHEFPRMETGKYVGIVAAPMTTAIFEPDVAVIYCNSAQLTRLLLGIAYHDGRDVTTVLGGHAACVYAVVPALLTRKCQVAIPCRGDRGRAGAQDDELIFSVPKERIGDLAFGLEQKGTGSLPTGFSMTPEYDLSHSYAKMARQMGQKKADGSEIKGSSGEERRRDLQYR